MPSLDNDDKKFGIVKVFVTDFQLEVCFILPVICDNAPLFRAIKLREFKRKFSIFNN